MNRARPSRHDDPSGPSTLDDRNREAGAARQRRSKGHRGGKLILRDRARPGDRPQGGLPPDGQPKSGLPLAGILWTVRRSEVANGRRPPSVDQNAKPATLAGAGRACRRHEGARRPLWLARGPKVRRHGGLAETPAPFSVGRVPTHWRPARYSPCLQSPPVRPRACHLRTQSYLRADDDVRTQHSRLPASRLSGPATAGPSPARCRRTSGPARPSA